MCNSIYLFRLCLTHVHPRPYFGTFVEFETSPSFVVDSIFVNGGRIYRGSAIYDPEELWIVKHSGLNTWILTESEPTSPPSSIIATCICLNQLQCDLIDCQEWYWDEQMSAVTSELLPSVKILNRKCETCKTNDDCNAYRAEICCDGMIKCDGIAPKTCVHVGWIKFMDHKIYVLESDGVIGVPIERYGFIKHVKLPASAKWKVIPGTAEPDNKAAVYYYDLPLEEQEIVRKLPKSMVGGPHYDFTTENPNNTKHWQDEQLSYTDIMIEIHDDGLFEPHFEEFQLQLFPHENVFLKPSDINIMSVIIIGPNGGNRGLIQFADAQYEVYEEDQSITIPVQRVNGSDGDISVEYFVINHKLPESATFGRDYQEFGVWERLLHHECDYLKPLGSMLPAVTDLVSAQRYFDRIAQSGRLANESQFSSDEFLSAFLTASTAMNYQYPKEWSKGFGCCSDTTRPKTYPHIYDYEWLQFRLEWPLDPTIEHDQIWAQMKLPTDYNHTTVTTTHPADISVTRSKYNNEDYGPYLRPQYTRAWKGLVTCDPSRDCVFDTVPVAFEIGKQTLEKDPLSMTYKPEYCLTGPFIDASFAQANAASLYIKNFKTSGRLRWADGDEEPKSITIQLINDDEYEPTESFTVGLSVTPHPNPEYNPSINPDASTTTIYIMGPNDVNMGSIGFADYKLYTNEGELFCIPLVRSGGSDETAYVQYSCEGQTAQDGKDFQWKHSSFGEFMWPTGRNDTKCINIEVFKDQIYEEDEDILCEVTMLWSDYSDLKPQEGHMKAAIIIQSNDDQMRLDTPWIIANEGNTAKMRVSRFGFKGKDVSVKYTTASCSDEKQCKLAEFATPKIDFNETIGELWFLANESFGNKTIEIPIISDGIREETEAFMFFIEKGEIRTPNNTQNTYKDATYIYNTYQSTAIIWIHGPNDIPKTEFKLWHESHNRMLFLDEPQGNITMELYSIYVNRVQDQKVYDFECSVKIHCDAHTASAGRDFVCNDTTLYWAKDEDDIKEFKFGLYNDEHWEHEEVFYITLSDPVNGLVREQHKHITVAIIANDKQNCTGSIVWSEWTDCSVDIGTGIKMRYKTSIQKDKETGKIQCLQLSQSEYCQMMDHSPVGISVSASIVTLYEGDYERDHQTITYSLGGTPNFYDDKYAEDMTDDESLEGCIVKLLLVFDDNLDVSATPTFLCWTNTTWAEERNVTIRVDDNDKIDSEDPRKRWIEVGELLSVDPLYNALNIDRMRIEVEVFDDEFCDPDICSRGALSSVYNEIEYEDQIQEIETDNTEVAVILAVFGSGVICLIGLLINNRIKNNAPQDYQALEEQEQKQALDQEMKEIEEIEKMDKYLAKQHERKMKKAKRKIQKIADSEQVHERESLLAEPLEIQNSDASSQ
eukprot:795052_1